MTGQSLCYNSPRKRKSDIVCKVFCICHFICCMSTIPRLVLPAPEPEKIEEEQSDSDDTDDTCLNLESVFGALVPREYVCHQESLQFACFTHPVRVIHPWFYRCFHLKYVAFEHSPDLTVIGNNAFEYTQLSFICIPPFVTTIQPRSFACCRQLQRVYFSSGALATIGSAAFTNTGLTALFLPPTVQTIGDSCFESCTSLTLIDFPLDIPLTKLANSALASTSLLELRIPSRVTTLSSCCLEDTPTLRTVESEPHSILTHLGKRAFRNCSSLHRVSLPTSLQVIDDECFASCHSLCVISFHSFPDNLRAIGRDAFAQTHVSHHTLGTSLHALFQKLSQSTF